MLENITVKVRQNQWRALIMKRREIEMFGLGTLINVVAIIAAGIVLFGIVITVMCAFFSVNRFLRMRGNDLYFI